jgi:hypothetical protein
MITKGGKRQGAGRPPAPAKLKKESIHVKLPKWLIEWMSEQSESRAVIIEAAIKKSHDIQPPSVKLENKHD